MDRLENLKNIIMYLMADEHVSHRIPSSLEERQRMMRALMNVWEPRPIAEDFLTMQDAELQMLLSSALTETTHSRLYKESRV